MGRVWGCECISHRQRASVGCPLNNLRTALWSAGVPAASAAVQAKTAPSSRHIPALNGTGRVGGGVLVSSQPKHVGLIKLHWLCWLRCAGSSNGASLERERDDWLGRG